MKNQAQKSMSYKSKLIDAAKFYEDCSSSFARKVSVPFITPVSRRHMRIASHVKSLRVRQIGLNFISTAA